jgi:hypothetical protein
MGTFIIDDSLQLINVPVPSSCSRDAMAMAKLTFSLANLPSEDQMPALCARCGRPASGTRRVRLKVYKPYPGPELIASLAGISDDEQRRWHDVRQLFAQGKGVVALPVCWWHRWIMPPLLGIKSMTGSRVTLGGLADSFVQAMKQRGWSGA